MTPPLSRRAALKTMALAGLASLPGAVPARVLRRAPSGWVKGKMSGAEAVVETLKVEGTHCVFGIPGAQENELWDAFKKRGLDYLLVTHEYSAAVMADGYARSTGEPGVLCVVPGCGVTNALTGLGESLLDSIPVVAIIGDVARGDKYRPFQVHELDNVALLKPVTKDVICVNHQDEIANAIRNAFQIARCGEPGPVAVVIPWNYLIAKGQYNSPPGDGCELPLDEDAFLKAVALLSCKGRIGIYAGLGCMDCGPTLLQVAEMLQAPVATSVSGKGVIDEAHPLAVGWGYGPQGTKAAEEAFKGVETVLAIGVKYSEVSTGFYSIPKHPCVIHVDINEKNLGASMKADLCVHAESSAFLAKLLEHDELRRDNTGLHGCLKKWKDANVHCHEKLYGKCGIDPMAFVLALRRCTRPDALVYVDVTLTEHLSAEAFCVHHPRTYFNPVDNQSMGWSIPAALGGQKAHPGRQVVTITGDGCLLMSAMELSTASRAALPVKFFILDDGTYHYMQVLQQSAYRRTTATILPRLDYEAMAKAMGLMYWEIKAGCDLEAGINGALAHEGPVFVRVVTDYGKRPIRWIEATKDRFTEELSTAQKAQFAARIGVRSVKLRPWND